VRVAGHRAHLQLVDRNDRLEARRLRTVSALWAGPTSRHRLHHIPCVTFQHAVKVIWRRPASLQHAHLCNCIHTRTHPDLITSETPIKLPISMGIWIPIQYKVPREYTWNNFVIRGDASLLVRSLVNFLSVCINSVCIWFLSTTYTSCTRFMNALSTCCDMLEILEFVIFYQVKSSRNVKRPSSSITYPGPAKVDCLGLSFRFFGSF